MHEVPGGGVDAYVLRAQGCDGGSGGVHADEMHRHVAVPLEGGGNGECGGERAACAVNQHIHRLAGVLGEYVVHIIAVSRNLRQSLSDVGCIVAVAWLNLALPQKYIGILAEEKTRKVAEIS